MSVLRSFKPADVAFARWVRDVAAALEPLPTVTYTHDFDALPIAVKVGVSRPPLSVRVLRSAEVDGSTVVSGSSIEWSWAGDRQIEVADITSITAGVHVVTLEIRAE